MDRCVGAAARLPGGDRKELAIQALARSETVSDLAARHGVSRKFVYQQTHKADAALADVFSPATPDGEVLFELAVTKAWLRQVIVGLTLICRGSYRGVVEFLRDLLPDASARCGSRCRTSATPCSPLPACSMASWPRSRKPTPSPNHSCVKPPSVLHRLPSTSPAYWQEWNRLRATMGGKFYVLFDAVSRAMADTPRSSSLVENLNSRLRTYFTLRRHLGGAYLDLLQFFLNHRCFMRSRRAERQGKSPRELMTGQRHPHWLTLLGLGLLQPQQT